MGKQSIDVLVQGGKATPAPPLGPTLSQYKLNIGKVVQAINEKTKDFAGMEVPVKITFDPDTKEFEISVGTPPVSALLKKETGAKVLGGQDVKMETIVKVAKAKGDDLVGSMKAKVKQVLGVALSAHLTVEGKSPKEVQKEVDEGKWDSLLGD